MHNCTWHDTEHALTVSWRDAKQQKVYCRVLHLYLIHTQSVNVLIIIIFFFFLTKRCIKFGIGSDWMDIRSNSIWYSIIVVWFLDQDSYMRLRIKYTNMIRMSPIGYQTEFDWVPIAPPGHSHHSIKFLSKKKKNKKKARMYQVTNEVSIPLR